MSTTTITLYGTFATITCCNKECGIMFAVPKEVNDELLASHQSFYCPRGHIQHYVIESEEEKLQREVARKQAYIDAVETDLRRVRESRDHHERSARTYRGQVTKIKRRVASGVCPCCHRSFSNLAAHMKGQHPMFGNGA